MTATSPLPLGRKPRSLGRRFRWLMAGLVVMAAVGVIASFAPFGGRATGARLERMGRSPQWQASHFENQQPIVNDDWAAIVSLFKRDPNVIPKAPPSTVLVEPARFARPPASGLRVTRLGHSTILLEIDGHRFLTDPVWSDRAGPVQFSGPNCWFPPLISLQDLPPLDGVVLSDDHYGHFDYQTIVALKERDLTFIAPLGVGAHLERWGLPASRIVELGWWDSRRFGGLTLWVVPAQHASGRIPAQSGSLQPFARGAICVQLVRRVLVE